MCQFLNGNPHTYTTSRTQLLYAGHNLIGSAGQWYRAHVDPATQELPPSYDLASFSQALEASLAARSHFSLTRGPYDHYDKQDQFLNLLWHFRP